MRKNVNQRQFSNKRGAVSDDTYAHDEEINGTSQERRHRKIISNMTKKYKVPVSAAQGQGGQDQQGGSMGGMM